MHFLFFYGVALMCLRTCQLWETNSTEISVGFQKFEQFFYLIAKPQYKTKTSATNRNVSYILAHSSMFNVRLQQTNAAVQPLKIITRILFQVLLLFFSVIFERRRRKINKYRKNVAHYFLQINLWV